MSVIRRFLREESAATMVEYGVMVALVAAIAIVTVKTLGTEVNDAFTTINSNMP